MVDNKNDEILSVRDTNESSNEILIPFVKLQHFMVVSDIPDELRTDARFSRCKNV